MVGCKYFQVEIVWVKGKPEFLGDLIMEETKSLSTVILTVIIILTKIIFLPPYINMRGASLIPWLQGCLMLFCKVGALMLPVVIHSTVLARAPPPCCWSFYHRLTCSMPGKMLLLIDWLLAFCLRSYFHACSYLITSGLLCRSWGTHNF